MAQQVERIRVRFGEAPDLRELKNGQRIRIEYTDEELSREYRGTYEVGQRTCDGCYLIRIDHERTPQTN